MSFGIKCIYCNDILSVNNNLRYIKLYYGCFVYKI